MKKKLRKEIIDKRLLMSKEDIHHKSQLILNHVKAMDFESYDQVMIFMDFRNEVETTAIVHYLFSLNKQIVIPKVNMKTKVMTLHKIQSLDHLIKSSYGILEPSDDDQVGIHEIDYIFVPGVAFDQNGMRLGYGGGFYDRLLSNKRKDAPTTALVFDFQIVSSVPYESYDVPVEYLLTEKGLQKI